MQEYRALIQIFNHLKGFTIFVVSRENPSCISSGNNILVSEYNALDRTRLSQNETEGDAGIKPVALLRNAVPQEMMRHAGLVSTNNQDVVIRRSAGLAVRCQVAVFPVIPACVRTEKHYHLNIITHLTNDRYYALQFSLFFLRQVFK